MANMLGGSLSKRKHASFFKNECEIHCLGISETCLDDFIIVLGEEWIYLHVTITQFGYPDGTSWLL